MRQASLMPTPPLRPVLRPADPPETGSLVERLGEALGGERVAYLQWKGNWKRSRWMSGEGDIDLLVHRSAEPRYSAVLWSLGFRRADPPPASAIAGIESYFGLDPATGRLIHVHTHYRLVVGGIWRTVYRLPIEEPLLASAIPGAVFPVAAPEYELIAFAARMVQRYNALDTVLRRQPRWLKGIQAELDSLIAKANRGKMAEILEAYLPTFDLPFIDLCLASLRPRYSRWRRLLVRRELHRRLLPHARRPPIALTLNRIMTRALTLGGSGPRLDGLAPLAGTRFGRWLVAKEAGYYRHILAPDVLILLRVDPETAVRRKTDEPAEYVRARCQLVWDTDWTGSRVHIVDASRPLEDVLAEIKAILWELL